MSKREITVGTETVVMDSEDLKFNERNLSQFWQRVGGRINYIGEAFSLAAAIARSRQKEESRIYLQKFKYWKSPPQSKSDKTAENYAKADDEYQQACDRTIEAQLNRDLLYNHLQALQAARDDSHNVGHFLRAEMKNLNLNILDVEADPLADINDIVKDAASYQQGP